MTEEQIIKAWVQKVTPVQMGKMQIYDAEILCSPELVKDTLSLLNRQKVENKALKHYYDECMKDLKNAHTELERLKRKIKTRVIYYLDTNEENGVVYIPKFELDNLVIEMTEENHDE